MQSLFLGLILISFFINSIIIVPFINFIYRIGFIERKPSKKRAQESPIDKLHLNRPRMLLGGGIPIILTTTIIYLLSTVFLPSEWQDSIYPFVDEVHLILFTFLSFALLGFYDDWVKIFGKARKGRFGIVFGLTEKQKFLLQWVIGLIIGALLYWNLKLDFIYAPIINKTWHLGWFFIPFSAFVIIAFSNAYNITDGLAGLSTGLLLIALIAFIVIAFSTFDLPILLFIGSWLGGIISFLYFNIYPARIILGDAGALSFGATLGLIGLLTGKIFALTFIGGVFLIEILSSLIQIIAIRWFNKKVFPLAPLHHTFEALGWPEPKIVMRAWLAGVILAIFGIWLALG